MLRELRRLRGLPRRGRPPLTLYPLHAAVVQALLAFQTLFRARHAHEGTVQDQPRGGAAPVGGWMTWDFENLRSEILDEFSDSRVDRWNLGVHIIERSPNVVTDAELKARRQRRVQYQADKQRELRDRWRERDRQAPLTSEAREALRRSAELRRTTMKREKFPTFNTKGEYRVRDGETTHFVINTPHLGDYENGVDNPRMIELDGYLTINVFPDGRPGELFVRMGKQGSSLAWVDEWCTQLSLLLQGGLTSNAERWTVDTLCKKFAYKTYWPFGGVKGCESDGVLRCTSITDLLCKILLSRFGKKKTPAEIEAEKVEVQSMSREEGTEVKS